MTTNWLIQHSSPPVDPDPNSSCPAAASSNNNYYYSCNNYYLSYSVWESFASHRQFRNSSSEMGSREEPTLEASCQTERVPASTYDEGLGVALAEISSQNTTTAVAAWIATSSQQLISPTAAGPNVTAFNTNAGIPVRVPMVVEVPPQNVPSSLPGAVGPYMYQPFQPSYSQVHFPPGHPPPGWPGESMRHFPIVPVPRYAAPDPRNFPYSNFYGPAPIEGNPDWTSNAAAHTQIGNQAHPQLVTPASTQLVTQARPQTITQTPSQILNQTYPHMGSQVNKNTYYYSTGSSLKSPEQATRSVSIIPQPSEPGPQPSSSKKQDIQSSKFNSVEISTFLPSEQPKSVKKKQIESRSNLTGRASIENIPIENAFESSSFTDAITFSHITPRTPGQSNSIMTHIVNPALADNDKETVENDKKNASESSSKIRKKSAPIKKKQITETKMSFKTPIGHVKVVSSNKRKRLPEGVSHIDEPSAEHTDNIDRTGVSEKKLGPGTKKKKSKAELVTPMPDMLSDDETRKDKATMLNKLRYRLRSAFAQSKTTPSNKVEKEMNVSPGSASTGKTKGKVKKGKKPKTSRSLGSTPNGKALLSPLVSKGTYSPDIVSPRSLGSGNDSIDSSNDKMPALDIHFSAEKENEILVKMRSWTLNKLEGETVLHRAATLGLPDVVSYCMSRQIMLNPNCVNNHGYSPLHDACVHGHEKVVEALLTFRAGPSKKAPGGVRPLHLAAKHGHLEIVKLLLSRGADPNLKTEKGESVFDIAEHSVKVFLSSSPSPGEPAPAPAASLTDQSMTDTSENYLLVSVETSKLCYSRESPLSIDKISYSRVLCPVKLECYSPVSVSILNFARANDSWRWNPSRVQPGEVFVTVYLFNVTNPVDTIGGGKPILAEVGPYVYREHRERFDISSTLMNTVKFRERKTYEFVPELSQGSENDVLNFVNIPMVSAIPNLFRVPFVGIGMIAQILKAGEKLVKENIRLGDILYEGVSVQVYIDILKALKQDIPPEMEGGKFGVFRVKNGTDEGMLEVQANPDYLNEVGDVVSWKNLTKLNFWNSDKCNSLKGRTDGTVFPPGITKSSVLEFFNPEACRSLSLVYERDQEVHGVLGYRFKFPDSMLEDPEKNYDNICYCTEYDELDEDYSVCPKRGVMDLSPCREDAPVFSSFPHFLDADPLYLEGVEGMNPDREKHESYIVIEPKTGTVLRSSFKFQLNIQTDSLKKIQALKEIPGYMFPVLWLEYAFTLSPEASESLNAEKDDPYTLSKIEVTETSSTQKNTIEVVAPQVTNPEPVPDSGISVFSFISVTLLIAASSSHYLL
ncbi:unnamed protein product [Allacma fusca]|uniref:Scavenger receptor class B member 1 n=1 Tax=Allacma fusca TaxID=39272 RepID=A0A8J2JEZ1_9HEXA|nr:unnamed protein product [Allacma fusca]